MTPKRSNADEPHGTGRTPVFDRLRAQHAWVLEALDALELELAGHRSFTSLRPAAERLAREFAAHASDEDEVLMPLLVGGLPDAPSGVRALVAEHAELRAMLVAFLALLGQPASARRDEQLTVQARDLTALMRSQIRKEETLVCAIAEQVARGAAVHHAPFRAVPRAASGSRPRSSKGEPR